MGAHPVEISSKHLAAQSSNMCIIQDTVSVHEGAADQMCILYDAS